MTKNGFESGRMALLSLAVALGVALPLSVEGAVSTNTGVDASGTTTLTTDTYWSGGSAPSKDVEGAAETDFMLSGTIRLPGSSFTCYGKSLRIGDATHVTGAYLKGGPLTFRNEGLILSNGILGNWLGGNITQFFGPVLVDCLGDKPFTIENKQNQANTGMLFVGPISCPNASHVLNLTANPGAQIWFGGGLVDFNGTIRATANNTLRIGTSSSEATIDVQAGAVFGTYTATDVVAVKALTLANGAGLEIMLGGTSTPTAGLIRVTGTLSLPTDAKVPLTLFGTLARETDQEARVLPVFAAPKSAALATNLFEVGDLPTGSEANSLLPTIRELQVVPGETEDVLCLVTRRISTYNLGQDGAGTSGFQPQWASRWTGQSDGDDWNPDWDYLAVNRTIREPDWTTNNWWTFGGHQLSIRGGAIATKANCHLVIPNGVFHDMNLSHWGGNAAESLPLRPYAFGGATFLSGRVRIVNTATFSGDSARTTVVDAELTGSGTLNVTSNKGNNSTRFPDGIGPVYCELLGTNENFSGAIVVKTGGSGYTSSHENRATLVVDNPYSLGGPCTDFTYNAVSLSTYGTLWAHSDVAFDVATRGIYVSGHGQFEVDAGATLTLRQQLTLNGTVHKAGTGTLALGGGGRVRCQ